MTAARATQDRFSSNPAAPGGRAAQDRSSAGAVRGALQGKGFEAQTAMLAPRAPAAVQLKAGGTAAKVTVEVADAEFNRRWKRKYGGKPAGIAPAEQETRDHLGSGIPDGWMPPPKRAQATTGDAPDASSSSQAPGPLDGVGPCDGETPVDPADLTSEPAPFAEPDENGQTRDIKTPEPKQSVDTRPDYKAPASPEQDDKAPGADQDGRWKQEADLPIKGPWGLSFGYDAKGNYEASGSFSVELPEVSMSFAPVPVMGVLRPDFKGSVKVTSNPKTKKHSFALSGTFALVGSLELGVPGLSGGVGIEVSQEAKIELSYDGNTGKWDLSPVTITLSVAPVLTGKFGPVPLKHKFVQYDLLVVTIGRDGVDVSQGPGVEEFKDDIMSVLPGV